MRLPLSPGLTDLELSSQEETLTSPTIWARIKSSLLWQLPSKPLLSTPSMEFATLLKCKFITNTKEPTMLWAPLFPFLWQTKVEKLGKHNKMKKAKASSTNASLELPAAPPAQVKAQSFHCLSPPRFSVSLICQGSGLTMDQWQILLAPRESNGFSWNKSPSSASLRLIKSKLTTNLELVSQDPTLDPFNPMEKEEFGTRTARALSLLQLASSLSLLSTLFSENF